MSSVRSTAVATVCTILLASCAVIPNDYANPTYNPSVKARPSHSLPSTVLTPRGTLLIIPNYSTGATMAIIKVSQ